MDSKEKNEITKNANYTNKEKDVILKKTLIDVVSVLIIFLGLAVFNTFHMNEKYRALSLLYFLMPVMGLIFAIWGVVRILQIKSSISKYYMAKFEKILFLSSTIFFFAVFLHYILSASWFPSYHTSDITEYDKTVILDRFGGDLDSNLSIFPDGIAEDAKVQLFETEFQSGLFDTDGKCILVCRYQEDQLQKEIERLSSLEMDIVNLGGKERYTNPIRYDESSYRWPAYVANAGFGNTYEYALVNEEFNEIAYLYLAYPDPNHFPYPEYLLLDVSAYEEENTWDAFSMYNHSFDGGRS